MKYNIQHSIIILTGVIMLLFSACEDFLKEENYSSIVADELYETETGYESLINSCYASLRGIYGTDIYPFCAGTDMYVEGGNSQPEGISEYRSLNPEDDEITNFYDNLYSSIQICNTAIHYNSKTENFEALAQRLAEARFLRSLDYFSLVKHFGGVALVTDMVDQAVVAYERSTSEQVYDFIINELKESIIDLPETTEQPGRVTKRAARHFLAKVYLTRGYEEFGTMDDFTSAVKYAEEAIANQGLNLTFSEVFWPGNEENEEVIFSVQYGTESMIDNIQDGNTQNAFFKPYLGGNGNEEGYPNSTSTLRATMYVFDLYNQYDSRWEATFMNVMYNRYYDYFDKSDSYDELDVYYYYPHAWEVTDTAEWRAASTHRSSAVISPYSNNWEGGSNGFLPIVTPSPKKFDDPTSIFGTSSNTRDIILARLADTYLVAAEAYLKAGNSTKATEMLNVVRTRAAVTGKESEMQLSEEKVDIDMILDERARELFGEYHRWEDLKRTGMLVERTKLYNRDIKNWFDNGINPFEGTDGELKLLRPIPQEALDLNQNEGFTQNPGY